MAEIPTVWWAMIATGLIPFWFVENLVLSRPDAPVKHVIQAIGSSSKAKGEVFAAKHCPNSKPTIYDSYEAFAVYPNYAADATALNVLAGRKESDVMP
ncbi:hypothetical protein CHU98_g12217 [Xylaria longipes]|nr:hypothetical protein CHU98_g12217 [Xylaria longipes]